MKNCSYKIAIAYTCIGLFIFLAGQRQVEGQIEEQLTLKQIIKTLKFKSKSKSMNNVNEQLIMDVRNRTVGFELTAKSEKTLKNAGANAKLIKVIRENTLKSLNEATTLYKKFTDNYDGTLEQKKLALTAAKEFMDKYSSNDEANNRQVINYLREFIPYLEQVIRNKNCDCP